MLPTLQAPVSMVSVSVRHFPFPILSKFPGTDLEIDRSNEQVCSCREKKLNGSDGEQMRLSEKWQS
jgi:hypothetical protein